MLSLGSIRQKDRYIKAAFESVRVSDQASFLIREFEEPRFLAPYHFHPEYELTWIVRGCGKRYVGAHMCDYFPDDLVLLGATLPHCWKTVAAAGEEYSRSIVIHFGHDFMGEGFFNKPEMADISSLLDKSRCGIQFRGDTQWVRQKMLATLRENNPLKRFVLFLEIMHELAAWQDFVQLDLQEPSLHLSAAEKERMSLVTAYIVDNFSSQLSLAEAAARANMTYHAFCKYFKKAYRMTFMEAVTGYRVDLAMRQLAYTDKPISRIAFDSGFNDISNFHKTFRARMGMSPLHYRKQFKSPVHSIFANE